MIGWIYPKGGKRWYALGLPFHPLVTVKYDPENQVIGVFTSMDTFSYGKMEANNFPSAAGISSDASRRET